MTRINVGDIVKVKDWGESYTWDAKWFLNHNIDAQFMTIYAFGDNRKFEEYEKKEDTTLYKVLAIADNKALISKPLNSYNLNSYNPIYNPAYLIKTEALINIKEIRYMTVKEIEDELGYPIKIVE